MSRSQRHKIAIQNTSTRGEIYAEGRVAPAVLLSATPATPAVPTGPSGGPLKGSSMMGAVPVGWTVPVAKASVVEETSSAPPNLELGQGAAPSAGQRDFPIGPLPLLAVEPSENPVGVWYVVGPDDGENLIEGDEVTIEATGAAVANGNYTVAQLNRGTSNTRFFVPGTALPAPIEGKGRITITDKAL